MPGGLSTRPEPFFLTFLYKNVSGCGIELHTLKSPLEKGDWRKEKQPPAPLY